MSRNLRTLVLTGCLASQPLLAQPGPASLTPQQTYDLYARAFINGDSSSIGTINDSMRTAMDGEDLLSTDAVSEMHADLRDAIQQDSLTLMGKRHATLTGYADRVADLAVQALRDVQCQATSSRLAPDEDDASQQDAWVSFRCEVPARSADLLQTLRKVARSNDLPRLKAGLDDYLASLQNAPLRPMTGTFLLYPARDGQYWYNGDPGEVANAVVQAIYPGLPDD
ncbi:MAG: hypothetical protein GAK45_01264 [Pseudomonas citronellolis]|nr:MAG: hypothetical protein GAK45_01264 [Pseudomonas citronellolis]